MAHWYATVGDAGTEVTVYISDTKGPVDLTGATIEFTATLGETVITAAATPAADQVANKGQATAVLSEADLADPPAGEYAVRWNVTFAGGTRAKAPRPGKDRLVIEA